jgi:transcription initiation factor IIE alpha subunit
LDLWTRDSLITNFADDTQSVIVKDEKAEAVEIAKKEANSVIGFFENNNFVNNADKAAILYNSGGKGDSITIEGIGGEKITSTDSEKLLGLHINSSFEWNTHIEKLVIELKKRMGLLKRIKQRVPKEKLIIIAEAIFNSKIRYGIAAYLIPIFEREEVKTEKLSPHAKELQVVQNSMVRVIQGLKRANHVNMKKERDKLKMLSVNQMAVYHTVMEAYNITNKNASDQLQKKLNIHEGKHSERSAANNELYVPEKPRKKCTGFSYIGPKLYNMIPKNIKEAKTTDDFKTKLKGWIWKNIH